MYGLTSNRTTGAAAPAASEGIGVCRLILFVAEGGGLSPDSMPLGVETPPLQCCGSPGKPCTGLCGQWVTEIMISSCTIIGLGVLSISALQ